MHIWIYILYIHIYTYNPLCTYAYICMYIYIRTNMCVCTHTCTHTHRPLLVSLENPKASLYFQAAHAEVLTGAPSSLMHQCPEGSWTVRRQAVLDHTYKRQSPWWLGRSKWPRVGNQFRQEGLRWGLRVNRAEGNAKAGSDSQKLLTKPPTIGLWVRWENVCSLDSGVNFQITTQHILHSTDGWTPLSRCKTSGQVPGLLVFEVRTF